MGMFNFYKKSINIFALILWISLFLVNTDTLQAQGIKVFTSDKLKFPEDIKDYFEAADKKPGRVFGDSFILFWNSGKLTEEEKEEIISTCNLYVKKRIKTFPDLKNYLESFRLFKESSPT